MSTNNIVYSTLLTSILALSVPTFQACRSHQSTSSQMTDASITTGVKSKLIASSAVKARDIDVDTREGIVYLIGRVGSSNERSEAERLARSVDGVRDVKNELLVGEAK